MSVALSYGNTIIRFGNVAISAGVVSPIYNVSLIQDAHGTIAASPMSGHPNQTVTLSNTPATHYHFGSYSVSGATLTGNQFKLVDQDVTAKGTFVEDDKYNLTLQTNGYGTISASKTTGYAGDTVTLSNTPSADCTFSNYSITGATLTGNQFNFGSSNVTAKANFNRNVHSVTVQNDGHGTLAASPTTGYSGTQVTLTTAANAGYLFSGYTITGATLTGNKFNIGTSNVTVKAWFKDPYANSAVKIGNQTWLKCNLDVDDGGSGIKRFDNVTVNGVNFGTQYYYTWDAAVRVAASIPGWHLPTSAEWNQLDFNNTDKYRSTTGWSDGGNGTNAAGLNIIPVGRLGNISDNSIEQLGIESNLWSCTEVNAVFAKGAFFYNWSWGMCDVDREKTWCNSVRLIKDA